MAGISSSRSFSHAIPDLPTKLQEKESYRGRLAKDRVPAANTAAHSESSATSRSRTIRAPAASLKSRIPWLDSRSGSKRHSVAGSQAPRSSSQTRLLPMTETRRQSRAGTEALQTITRTRGSHSPKPITKISLSRSRPIDREKRQSTTQSLLNDNNTRKASIVIPMQAIAVGDLQPATEETPLSSARTRKKSLFEILGRSKATSGSIPSQDPTDSMSELDTSPLTDAIKRLEGLMKEAEDLVNDAADSGHSEEAHNMIDDASTAVRSSVAAAADMAKDSTSPHHRQRRDLLVDASFSELSLDSGTDISDIEEEPIRFSRPSWEDGSKVRDFACPTTQSIPSKPSIKTGAEAKSRKASIAKDHWEDHGHKQLHDMHNVQIEHVRDADFNRDAHTAYISESPPLSPGTAEVRRWKKSVSIEEKPKEDWQPPRHNTYYDSSWQPNLDPPPPKSRHASIVPTPWNLKSRRRHGQHRCLNGSEVNDHDVEKDAGPEGTGRSRWHLGHVKSEPVARNWSGFRKRLSAVVACMNTGIVGYLIGVYAGMVPRIQFQLADQNHDVLLGNVYLFLGLAITTFFCWPLPLLHGRRPYILASLGLAIPLQFPQAILVSQFRPPVIFGFEFGLLTCRFITGLLLGLTNINDFATLLDLFGASLQNEKPHQEIVHYDDVRREGGGIGVWLGIWAWCWVGSVSVGFLSGAGIIGVANPEWGFFISVILMIFVMLFNLLTPETRHSSLRRTLRELKVNQQHEERVRRKVARGEIKLHISDKGPRYWFQELWAGVILSKRMFFQRGYSVVCLYLGWIYGQNILVIVLLGALLSRSYGLPSKYVGLGVLSISIGALLAIPLTHGSFWSRARKQGPRTDSMTFEPQFTWSSHMFRRMLFMIMLPVAGLTYTFCSPGKGVHFMLPILFAGAIGFFDSLAVAECYGLIMETYDLSDLQPGVNSKHRVQSMAENVRKRRTNYSSFPRVSAGIFLSQTFGFLFAAAATGVGGAMTRDLGAQYSTGVTAAILFFLTLLLTLALVRYKQVQVVPNHAFGTRFEAGEVDYGQNEDWKPVVIGNPSGKMRRVNLLEMGKLSRWTEIRRLNKLIE